MICKIPALKTQHAETIRDSDKSYVFFTKIGRWRISDVTGPSRHLLSNVAYTMSNAAPGDNQEAALWKDATSYLAIR